MKLTIIIAILLLIVLLLISIQFNSFKDGMTSPDGNPVFAIMKDNKCLNSELSMTSCSTSDDLLWYASKDKQYNHLISYSSGKCLTASMDSSYNYELSLTPCESKNTHQWSFPPNNPTFENNFTGNSCLDTSFNKLYMSNDSCASGDSGRSWSLHTFKS
jgi:hypothetical protein